MSDILQNQINEFLNGRSVTGDRAEMFLDALINEVDESLLADVFRAWNEKGIHEDEICSIAKIMRDRCTRVRSRHTAFVDIVGTGGSRAKTFNVSTAAAFVAAGAGVPVAKHGNRAATSSTGSADVLAELGVEPAVEATTAERCLNEIGVCFMFAPNFHRLSPTLATVRRSLGFPTIFNCVGPLCNPAAAPHQIIGVWSEEMVEKMAAALERLGTKRSWIVHGQDGLDEISLAGPTSVAEVASDGIRCFEILPDEFGLTAEPLDRIRSGSAAESAAVIRAVLEGRCNDEAAEKIVAMNAAAALFVSGHCGDLREGAQQAFDSIRGGNAADKLRQMSEAVGRT